MNITVGKKYVTRCGDHATITAQYGDSRYPFIGNIIAPSGEPYNDASWTREGFYINRKEPDELDIIKEYDGNTK